MEEIVMRLYYEGDVDSIPAREALAKNVVPSIVGANHWIIRRATPLRVEAEERGTGNVLVFSVENV